MDCPGAVGYQIQTRSSRLVRETGASASTVVSSTQSSMARPTANGPVGAGSATSLLCSSQSDPNKIPTPRTPKIANTAKSLSIRRSSGVRNSLPATSAASGTTIAISSQDTGGTTMNANADCALV